MASRVNAPQQKAAGAGLGTSLPVPRLLGRPARPQTSLNGVPKKLNTFDTSWQKGFLGTGLFVEDSEKSEVNILERVEKKKVLSGVESSGLLTLLEKTGLSLKTVEDLGLLSKAEKLGVLSLTESLLTADPGKTTALSIPLIVLAIVSLVLLPGETFVEDALRFGAAGFFFTGATALFVAGFVASALQED